MSSRSPEQAAKPPRGGARDALIEAAHLLVRRQGWAATSVDDLCRQAGVTKGAFFHHFASKDALGVASAERWTDRARHFIFGQPALTGIGDPLERVLAHIDMRRAMIEGPVEGFTCYVGTIAQEVHATNEPLRAAANASLSAYAERLAEDIQQAIDQHGIAPGVTALGLAYHVQATLQGAFVLAKAKNDPSIASDTIAHLKRYVVTLFRNAPSKPGELS